MFKLTLCFLVVCVAFLAVGIDSAQYCEESGVKFRKGESITVPGKCEQATCVDPEYSEVSYVFCTQYFPRPGCHVTGEDLSKGYPQCCPQVKC